MRIAIDARALLPRATGIGTYTRGIARALAARKNTAVGLFTPRPLPNGRDTGPWSVHADSQPFGMVWAQTTLPRRARDWGADVLLGALTIGPAYSRAAPPFVSVVHDLTPWTHPEWHAARTLVGFVPLWEATAERAARFVCVSHATARDLERLFPETKGRASVAWNGVDAGSSPGPWPPGPEVERTRHQHAAGQRFILYLGTLEPRKNVGGLLLACERLWGQRRSRPDLVLAGGVGWRSAGLLRRIGRSPFRDKIHLAGHVEADVARELYRAAEAFVYPSWSEGFGLPVLEAMACGIPVVTSTAPALVEIAGQAALFADPHDVPKLANQIARALEDEPLRERLRAQGPRQAAGFTWENAAETTARALEDAAGASPEAGAL
jgi:glycosyltransferase involved in cell wall biosynthesis